MSAAGTDKGGVRIKEVIYSPHYGFYINKVHRDAGYEMATFHIHRKFELYYQTEGTRKYFIGDAVYLIKAGDVVIIDQDDPHKTASMDDSPHTRIVMNFNSEYLEKLSALVPVSDLLRVFAMDVKVLGLSMKQKVIVGNLFERLCDLPQKDDPDKDILSVLLLAELLLILKRYAEEQKNSDYQSPRLSNKTIDRITKYISEHYASALNLQSIAAQFFISPFYLSRLFKKTMGISIVEYINSVRIRMAMHFLEITNLSVTGVSERVGFQTYSHFNRVFKQSTGLSPSQYRKYYRVK